MQYFPLTQAAAILICISKESARPYFLQNCFVFHCITYKHRLDFQVGVQAIWSVLAPDTGSLVACRDMKSEHLEQLVFDKAEGSKKVLPPNGMSKATVGPVQLTPTEPDCSAFPTRRHLSISLEKTAAYRPNLYKERSAPFSIAPE